MIISDRVRDLLNKVLPLFEQITFGDIIQRMQQDIAGGGGGGFDGLVDFVVNGGTGNLDNIATGTGPQVCIIFTGAAPVIEGIAAGADGKRVILKKVGAGSMTIKNAASATPADNIGTNTGADITLASGEAIELVYTTSGTFWAHVLSGIATSGGGATNTDIIFDPDIAATAGNRYKTWPEVMSAIAAVQVFAYLFVNKPGAFQPVSVPAGSYDLSKVLVQPTPGSIVPILDFADGTTITGFPQRVEGVQLRNNNTSAPLFTVPGFTICQLFDAAIVNNSTATQPAWLVPNGASATLQLNGLFSPIFKNGGGSEPIEVQGSLSIDCTRLQAGGFFATNDLFTNAFSGNGTITITSYILLPGGYTATHTNYDGVLNVIQREEARVGELIDAKFATELTDEVAWRKRSGVFISGLGSDYCALGFLPGSSPTVDYIPAGASWDFEVVIFAYYRGTPNAVPIYASKTLKYTMIHDATTGTVVATVSEIGSNGTLNIAVTAGGNGAAPQHPHVFVQNNDAHNIAVEWKWTRMKNSTPVTNS